MSFKLINSLDDDHLKWVCKISSMSVMDLLEKFDYNSNVHKIHVSGLAYGIWISSCNTNLISLDDVNDMIENNIKSNLN